MWWVYFLVPHADLLHADRGTSFWFGYLHIPVFGAIVATGAGLHAAAYYIEHHSELGAAPTVATVAVPVAIYLVGLYAIYGLLARTWDLFHGALVTGAIAVLAVAVWLAMTDVPMAVCLLAVTLAPVVVVVGYEVTGHRRVSAAARTAGEA
jgi:low temperature requirement protein LtrA